MTIRPPDGPVFVLVIFEAFENGCGILGGDPSKQLGCLVGLELADDIRQVFRMNLVEELPHLIGILFEDRFDVRSEQGCEAHAGRAQPRWFPKAMETPRRKPKEKGSELAF